MRLACPSIDTVDAYYLELNKIMTGQRSKRMLTSMSPESNKSEKYQGGDLCVLCKVAINNDVCCIQCQWGCRRWGCHNINNPGKMVWGTIYVVIFGLARPLMHRHEWSG